MQNLREVYISNIASAVKLNWKTVARISEKARCTISITQTPTGNVSSVQVHACNKYATSTFKKDAEKAVYRSQPLPKPPVKELFERKIDFIFKP
jgi:colicin import membrane protein